MIVPTCSIGTLVPIEVMALSGRARSSVAM
jgi:hypothetical protein